MEVYPRETVDRILPYKADVMFPFANQTVFSDEELMKSDLYRPEADIYSIPDGLLHDPAKKEKIEFTKTVKTENLFAHAMNLAGQGSNCWAVHGNHTASGKPIVSCDPHLGKLQFSIWYMNRLSWN